MKRIIKFLNDVLKGKSTGSTVDGLPNHYAGELNTERIKAYRKLHELYNLDEGTVRDIFCAGADWYKKQCEINSK